MLNNIRHFEDKSVTLQERKEILAITLEYFEKKRNTIGGKLILKKLFPIFLPIKQLEINLKFYKSVVNNSYDTLSAKDYDAHYKLFATLIKCMRINCIVISLSNSTDLYKYVLERTRISILQKRTARKNYNPTKLSLYYKKMQPPLSWMNKPKKKLSFPPFSLS